MCAAATTVIIIISICTALYLHVYTLLPGTLYGVMTVTPLDPVFLAPIPVVPGGMRTECL